MVCLLRGPFLVALGSFCLLIDFSDFNPVSFIFPIRLFVLQDSFFAF